VKRRLRALASLAAHERRFYAAGSIFVLVGIASGLSYPLLVQRLIDHGVMQGRIDRVNRLGVVLLLILVAEGIAQQIERRVMFRRAMKRAVMNTMRSGALGVKVRVSGRLNGSEIARTEWSREGRIPLHTFRAEIDYGLAEARTTYGVIGVKVWIFRGEILSRREEEQQKTAAREHARQQEEEERQRAVSRLGSMNLKLRLKPRLLLSSQLSFQRTGMFVDSAMEHSAVAPAGLLRHAIVLLENNDAEGRVPAPVHQLSGDGAPYDPCSHNADVIRVHRAGSLASGRRSSAQCSGCHSTSTAWAAQQRGACTTEVF
jgi:hypothetical protein